MRIIFLNYESAECFPSDPSHARVDEVIAEKEF